VQLGWLANMSTAQKSTVASPQNSSTETGFASGEPVRLTHLVFWFAKLKATIFLFVGVMMVKSAPFVISAGTAVADLSQASIAKN